MDRARLLNVLYFSPSPSSEASACAASLCVDGRKPACPADLPPESACEALRDYSAAVMKRSCGGFLVWNTWSASKYFDIIMKSGIFRGPAKAEDAGGARGRPFYDARRHAPRIESRMGDARFHARMKTLRGTRPDAAAWCGFPGNYPHGASVVCFVNVADAMPAMASSGNRTR